MTDTAVTAWKPAREGVTIQVVFEGSSGDHAVILLAADPDSNFIWGLKGAFLLPLSPFPHVLYLGQLRDEMLIVPILVPKPGANVDGMKIHAQSYFWNASGMEVLGTAQTVILLDKGY